MMPNTSSHICMQAAEINVQCCILRKLCKSVKRSRAPTSNQAHSPAKYFPRGIVQVCHAALSFPTLTWGPACNLTYIYKVLYHFSVIAPLVAWNDKHVWFRMQSALPHLEPV